MITQELQSVDHPLGRCLSKSNHSCWNCRVIYRWRTSLKFIKEYFELESVNSNVWIQKRNIFRLYFACTAFFWRQSNVWWYININYIRIYIAVHHWIFYTYVKLNAKRLQNCVELRQEIQTVFLNVQNEFQFGLLFYTPCSSCTKDCILYTVKRCCRLISARIPVIYRLFSYVSYDTTDLVGLNTNWEYWKPTEI